MNNSVELSWNLDPEPLKKEFNWNSAAYPILIELLSGLIGWWTSLLSSGLVQSNGSNPLKVLQQEYKVIYLMYQSVKLGLVLTVTYLQIYTLLNSYPVE